MVNTLVSFYKSYVPIQRYQLTGPIKPAFLDLGPEIEDISDNKIVKPKSHAFTAKLTPFVTYLITIINSLMTRREIIFKANCPSFNKVNVFDWTLKNTKTPKFSLMDVRFPAQA